ncbi:hypothetical protein [Yoonia sp. 208BN28-4]|uniref:hypothetical protein n=1 Tax=Yoonia sp. 208BN28-4 TaxID=3126505 RepID=UPI0030A9CF02
MRPVFLSALPALGLAASSAAALDGCNIAASQYASVVEPALIGTWSAMQGEGILQGGGQVIGFDAEDAPPAQDVQISQIGGEMVLTFPNGQSLYFDVMRNTVGGDYSIELAEGTGLSAVIDDLWAGNVACDEKQLPLLKVAGPMTSEDGVVMDINGWLHFIDDTTISGTWQWNATVEGTDMVMRHFLTLSR